jgi:alpha-N-arabinofuranosidase
MQAVALDVHVAGEAYDLSPAQEAASVGRIHHVSDLGPFQLLDAAATCDEAGRRLTLAVVNRGRDRDLAATIDLGSATAGSTADVWEVNGPHVAATNSFEAPRAVDVRASRLDLRGSRFDYTFPAHSVTLLHLPITR